MCRFLLPLLLFCFAGPLLACSCGGALTYAPIVASPVVTFGKTVETIETAGTIVPEKAETWTANKPAIPKSVYPDSVAGKPRLTLSRLQIFELPFAMRTEQTEESSGTQTISKPMVPPFGDDPLDKQQGEEAKPEEPPPPESDTNDEEEGTENVVVRTQSSSQSRAGALENKPGPPEGPSDASLPNTLTEPSVKNETPPEDSTPMSDPRNPEDSPLAGSISGTGGGGLEESQSWTITALVLLAAISTVAFLCTVFVVGEYRKRWLNAIMSQNGIVPSFQGGLYDIPTLSIGYRRYED